MDYAVVGALIAILAIILAYLIARAVALAYFRTKQEYMRTLMRGENEKEK